MNQEKEIEILDALFEATIDGFWMHETFYDNEVIATKDPVRLMEFDNEIIRVIATAYFSDELKRFHVVCEYRIPSKSQEWIKVHSDSNPLRQLAFDSGIKKLVKAFQKEFAALPAMYKTCLEPLIRYQRAYTNWSMSYTDFSTVFPSVTPDMELLNEDEPEIEPYLCEICQGEVLNTKNIGLYDGFTDKDTGYFVGNCCKAVYYEGKHSGLYGEKVKGMYSEVPVPVKYIEKQQPVIKGELSYEEKVKHVIHAINPYYEELIDNSDWIKPENQKIFPFSYFTNFHVQEMHIVCDGCGEPFTGNGNYDTAYFVHEAPGKLMVYHERQCRKAGWDVFYYEDQLFGYKNPISIHKSLANSEIHQLVFDEIRGRDTFRLCQYVPDGIPSIDMMRKEMYTFSGQGGGTGRGKKDKYYVSYNHFNVKWTNGVNSNKVLHKLTPAQLLKIINEILALNPLQEKVSSSIISDITTPEKAVQDQRKKKGLSSLIDKPLNGLEALLDSSTRVTKVDSVKPAVTPNSDVVDKVKSIAESYPGGKNASGTPQFLINQIPPVDCIVSGFLGHCAVMKNIKPAKKMIGMDIDKNVIDRWNKERPDLTLIADDFLKQTSWVNPKEFGKTLVFLDPPYLLESRSNQQKIYEHEFYTEEQHTKLLERAVKFPTYVMICAYENELYDKLLLKKGFRKVNHSVQTQQGRREEVIYLNYDQPEELHDYSFYGNDYRERWNNKKLVNRMIAQLKDMPALRRNMIIHHVQQNFK